MLFWDKYMIDLVARIKESLHVNKDTLCIQLFRSIDESLDKISEKYKLLRRSKLHAHFSDSIICFIDRDSDTSDVVLIP